MGVEYKGYYVPVDASLIADEKTEWHDTLKAARDFIKNHLFEKITSESDFIDLIAEPSHEVWKDFVSDSWEDKDFVILKHKVKLRRAYNPWNTGVTNAFAADGQFDLGVDNKQDKFLLARYPVGAVGLRYKTGWYCAYKAFGVISGDKRVLRYYDSERDVTFPSTVVNVFLTGAKKFARATIGVITRGLVLAQFAQDAGDTTTRDNIINTTNNVLGNTVKKMIDTSTYPSADIKIGWDASASKLYAYSTDGT